MIDDNTIKVQCRKCETVFVAVQLPIDVMQLGKKMKAASCPQCFTSAWKADLYTGGKTNERTK